MNVSQESLAERRQKLSEQIARQRTEFAAAYQGLLKPLHYTEVGIKGLQAVRQNVWLIALLPSVVGLGFSLLGWTKKGGKKKVRRGAREEEEEVSRKLKGPLAKWLGRGYAAFNLYRRVRPFIPL